MSDLEEGYKTWEAEDSELSMHNQKNLVEDTIQAIRNNRMTERGKEDAYQNLCEIEEHLSNMQHLKSYSGDTPQLLRYIVNEGSKAEAKTKIPEIKWKLRRIVQLAKQVLTNLGYYSYAYPKEYEKYKKRKYEVSELSQSEMDSMTPDEAYEYALRKKILDAKRQLENKEKALAMKLGETDARTTILSGKLYHRGKVAPYVSLDGRDIYNQHHRLIVETAESMLKELQEKRRGKEQLSQKKTVETLREKKQKEEQELSQKIKDRVTGIIEAEQYLRKKASG